MTNDELMNLMTDMGLHDGGMENWIPDNAWVEVVNKVIAIEREACAKLCDGIMQYYKTNTTMNTDQNLIGYMAAELCGVRIRGKQ